MRDDGERLQDILESIDRIDRWARRGRAVFQADELVQTWMVHHLEIVGEAARGVSEELKRRYPKVPWRAMVAFRNVLAHDYFGLDAERVWATIERDLPPLREQISAILQDLGGN